MGVWHGNSAFAGLPQLASVSTETADLVAQREAAVAEAQALRLQLAELDERRKLQDMAIGELDMSLQDLRIEVGGGRAARSTWGGGWGLTRVVPTAPA